MKRAACMTALVLSAVVSFFFGLAKQAQARIVFTPTNVVIKGGGQASLDLNNDGIVDFTFDQSFRSGHCFYYNVSISPAANNGVIWGMVSPDGTWASALNAGAVWAIASSTHRIWPS